MEVRPGPPVPLPTPPPFDPAALAGWLGAPIAVLSEPAGLCHYVTNETHSIGHMPEIWVAVTVQHRYDSDDLLNPGPAVMADVRTRLRQARGEPEATTVRQNLAEAIRDYMQNSAAQAGISLRPGNRPPELDAVLSRELCGWSWWQVIVDGAVVQWEFVPMRDFATGRDLIGVGGAVGDTLIAVVGSAQLLTAIALRLHGPR